MDVGEHRYLIIGGAGKAGTTSLFYYLASHPEVCPATVKETGFFLDADYPAPSIASHSRGLGGYDQFFRRAEPGAIRLEATPFYLYSSGTPRRIRDALPNALLVFSLREPVSFLVSTFRYLKQVGGLPRSLSFAGFMTDQFKRANEAATDRQSLTLSMGRFSIFLRAYKELFRADQLEIVFHEDLRRDCRAVVQGLCGFAGIDPAFYDDFSFKVHNPTGSRSHPTTARLLKPLQVVVKRLTYKAPGLHESLRRTFTSLRGHVAASGPSPEELVVSREVSARLLEYHLEEKEALEGLLGRPIPWQPFEQLCVRG